MSISIKLTTAYLLIVCSILSGCIAHNFKAKDSIRVVSQDGATLLGHHFFSTSTGFNTSPGLPLVIGKTIFVPVYFTKPKADWYTILYSYDWTKNEVKDSLIIRKEKTNSEILRILPKGDSLFILVSEKTLMGYSRSVLIKTNLHLSVYDEDTLPLTYDRVFDVTWSSKSLLFISSDNGKVKLTEIDPYTSSITLTQEIEPYCQSAMFCDGKLIMVNTVSQEVFITLMDINSIDSMQKPVIKKLNINESDIHNITMMSDNGTAYIAIYLPDDKTAMITAIDLDSNNLLTKRIEATSCAVARIADKEYLFLDQSMQGKSDLSIVELSANLSPTKQSLSFSASSYMQHAVGFVNLGNNNFVLTGISRRNPKSNFSTFIVVGEKSR
jgi:hypothetical protein